MMLILFRHKNKNYRMRVADTAKHPGDRDQIEVLNKDMLGAESWLTIPDGSTNVPRPEWLIRQALVRTLNTLSREISNPIIIDIGDT